MALSFSSSSHLLVLTGAGISAESGVPTFRASGGLWEGHRVEEVASPEGFAADPRKVWRFYSQRRADLEGIEPNRGHLALAAIEEQLGDRYLLVTQNVDGLHTKAGSRRVIELHGNLMRSKCAGCRRPPFDDRTVYAPSVVPVCDACQRAGEDSLLRPDIVWFGEIIDADAVARIASFVRQAAAVREPDGSSALHFLAVGTSGQVYPAAALVETVRRAGGRSWLVNAELPANAELFDERLLGSAGELLPALFAMAPGGR